MNCSIKKLFLFFVLTVLQFHSTAQNLPDSVETKIDRIANEISSANISQKELNNIRDSIYQIQNEGFILQETYRDYKNSLAYINGAIILWSKLKDTANEANIHKFKGLLLAYLGDFQMAKSEILKAIDLFTLKKLDFGVAVSEFDFSKVYELERNYDSALYFAKRAFHFWNMKQDTFRLVTVNNQLINLSMLTNDLNTAKIIQTNTKSLLEYPKLHWRPIIDFYFLSSRLYRRLNMANSEQEYVDLYNKKLDDVKSADGIEAKSSYESLSR